MISALWSLPWFAWVIIFVITLTLGILPIIYE
jgi:hypothetical protein